MTSANGGLLEYFALAVTHPTVRADAEAVADPMGDEPIHTSYLSVIRRFIKSVISGDGLPGRDRAILRNVDSCLFRFRRLPRRGVRYPVEALT